MTLDEQKVLVDVMLAEIGTAEKYNSLVFDLQSEIARLRLTDAEREALERAVETLDGWQKTGGYHSAIDDDAATLRGLLERMGGGR